MIRSLVFGAVLLAFFAGCRRAPQAPPAPPPPVVTVAKVVSYPVQSYHEYNGYLESAETVQIRARVKGLLTEVKFKDGDDIAANTPLYTIDSREYDSAVRKAEADIEKAKADSEKADAEIARADADAASADVQLTAANATVRRLQAAGSGASGEEVSAAKAKAAAADAAKKTAEANKKTAEASKKVAEATVRSGNAAKQTAELSVEYTKIKAPIAGRISRTLVTQGNLVGQTDATLLTTIGRMDSLHAYFDAPERDLVEATRVARSGGPSTVGIELGVVTETGFPHKGTLDFLENKVDSGTGTIRLRGVFENKPIPGTQNPTQWELYPGLFSRIRIPAGPKRDMIVIPEESLMTGQEGSYVYVLGERDKADGSGKETFVRKKTVSVLAGPPVWRLPPPDAKEPMWTFANPKPTPGSAPFNLRSVVAIETGLDPADVVIVVGLQKARPGAPVVPEPWDFRPPAK